MPRIRRFGRDAGACRRPHNLPYASDGSVKQRRLTLRLHGKASQYVRQRRLTPRAEAAHDAVFAANSASNSRRSSGVVITIRHDCGASM